MIKNWNIYKSIQKDSATLRISRTTINMDQV